MTSPQRPQDRAPFRVEPTGEGNEPSPASVSFTSSSTSSSGTPSSDIKSYENAPSSVRSQGVPSTRFGPASSTQNPMSTGPASRMPQSGVASIGPASNANPVSGVRRAQGSIYQAVRLLDKKHGSFFISRLILMTGVNLRTYDASTYDDPVVVGKVIKALRTLLPPTELDALLPLLSIQR